MLNTIISKLTTGFLHRLPPETAHHLALGMLEAGLFVGNDTNDPRLETHTLGRRFSNPIGLAAGFDKDCRAARALSHMGFGFVECGTVTPQPQPGNPRPRLFRLTEDAAIINRMGFNSAGAKAFERRLRRLRIREAKHKDARILGVNLGINKEGAQPARDYSHLVSQLRPLADYFTINLSSPNTPGLRALQEAGTLKEILGAIRCENPHHPPLVVKLAPDLPDDALPDIVAACIEHGAAGIIVSNTTLSRPQGLASTHRDEIGGLSGRPLSQRALEILRRVVALADRRLTIISSGGIETGFDVFERLRAGADLVQIYTAFIYEGPAVVQRIKYELLREMEKHGYDSLSDIRPHHSR